MSGPLSAFTGDYKLSAKTAELIIAPLDDNGKIDEDILGGARILQYFPESISQSKSANWQTRDIPGSNLPLYQWVSGGEGPLSFTASFTRDMSGEIGTDVEEDKYNVDIDAAIAWLRLLCTNDYRETAEGGTVATPPPVLWLHAVGTRLGYNKRASGAFKTNSGGIYCVLLEVDVTRDNWFKDGTVRKAEVSLSFGEMMQIGQGIYPYGRSDFVDMADNYKRRPSNR